MSEELKACPFCGGNAKLSISTLLQTPFLKKDKVKIECSLCQVEIYDIGMNVGSGLDVEAAKAKVVEQWNTRRPNV